MLSRVQGHVPYADLIWVESSEPDLALARRGAGSVHSEFPGRRLAYNCSPNFNWRSHLYADSIVGFQRELSAMWYAFQFITLAGFHSINHGMFELARGYRERQMTAYVELQQAEFDSELHGYTATRQQVEVGAGYFDRIASALNPESTTLALVGPTETEQFH